MLLLLLLLSKPPMPSCFQKRKSFTSAISHGLNSIPKHPDSQAVFLPALPVQGSCPLLSLRARPSLVLLTHLRVRLWLVLFSTSHINACAFPLNTIPFDFAALGQSISNLSPAPPLRLLVPIVLVQLTITAS